MTASTMAHRWRQVGYWVHEFFGENAYPRYVAAWQSQHAATAEHQMLTEPEFFKQRLERLYGSDVQRCC